MTTFHLNNRLSKYKPQIKFGGKTLEYDLTPKYLGVTLDRQLTYKHFIENIAAKLNTRNNIIHKLAGSSWGDSYAHPKNVGLGASLLCCWICLSSMVK